MQDSTDTRSDDPDPKIEVRCTEEFKTATRVQAAKNNEDMSKYIRRLIQEDIGIETGEAEA